MMVFQNVGCSFLENEKNEVGQRWRRGTSSIECGQVQTTLEAWEGATEVQSRCGRSFRLL
jgi:hypothetical protein